MLRTNKNKERLIFIKAHPEWTFRELGEALGITRQRVQQICDEEGYEHKGLENRRVWFNCPITNCPEGAWLSPRKLGFRCKKHKGWVEDGNPQLHQVKDMKPGQALRLVDHYHHQSKGQPTCAFHQAIINRPGWKTKYDRISALHDGNDLLVIAWPKKIKEVQSHHE